MFQTQLTSSVVEQHNHIYISFVFQSYLALFQCFVIFLTMPVYAEPLSNRQAFDVSHHCFVLKENLLTVILCLEAPLPQQRVGKANL